MTVVTTIDEQALAALSARFGGTLVLPGDEGYEAARRLWNGQIDRHPAVIARCRGTADVMAAVRFAREQGLELSVRGGGHGIAGHAVCEGGVVVDLSAMTGVRVDPRARTVDAQGGCLWSDVDRDTQAFGLAVTGGIVSHTGVAGLTLGGGIGHLARSCGLTIDNLLSCDVVTADGEHVVASEDEHPELFWALRGGGGNFGVVTSFRFRLHPVGPVLAAGMVVWPLDQAADVLGAFREMAADGPDEVGLLANLRLAPPLPAIPQEFHGTPVVAVLACHVGPVEAGEAALRPLREVGRPVVDTIGPRPYLAHQTTIDPAVPHGRHYYWKSWKLPPLTDAALGTMIEHARQITSPASTVPVFTLGGAAARVDPDATAYPNRSALHDINIVGAWLPDDPDPDRHVTWVRGFWEAMRPHAAGVYVNFLSDEPQSQLREAYGERTYARLVAVKDAYDPQNVFRGNHNIAPSSG